METEYTFGHSVDVNGDEWIDLGPMPDVSQKDDDIKNPFSSPTSSSVQASEATATVEPAVEPEPEPEALDPAKKAILPEPLYAPRSKAARSKEALMAFYLGRAKQMEAKHKKIVVSSTKSVVIRSLQEPERIGV
ncbi:hypothetical protein V7S43_014579 [Phytophthora oleae]|uniref:Uncharacterized protein n=1 Tax=Phytophthora oleae TaxID=2107226 RepID=A0ABD3F1Q6_9STRA